MFFRKIVTKSGDKEYAYLKLIENYRDGSRVRQRVVANLGSLDNISPQKASRLISGLARICGLNTAAESDPSAFGVNRVLESADILAVKKLWSELGVGRILEEEIGTDTNGESLVPSIKCMIFKRVVGNGHYRKVDTTKIPVAMEQMCNAQYRLQKRIYSELKKHLGIQDLIACHLLPCRFQVAKHGQWDRESHEGLQDIKELNLLVAATIEGIPLGFRVVHLPDALTILTLLESMRQEFKVEHLVVTGLQKIFKEKDFNYLRGRGFKYLYAEEGDCDDGDNSDKLITIPDVSSDSPAEDFYYNTITTGNEKKLFCYSPRRASKEKFALEAKVILLESELSTLSSFVESKSITTFLKEGDYQDFFNLTIPGDNNKIGYQLKEDVYRHQLEQCGKYQLKTNSKKLSDKEMIQTYNTSLKLKKDFSIINPFEFPIDLEAKKSCFNGYLVICYLSLLIEGFMEMLLKKNGLNITARRAMDSLGNIKITVNKLHNFEAIAITERDIEQERILEALGIQNLHHEISLGQMEGGNSKS